MIAIIVALASMLSIYWFLRLVWENKHFEYKFEKDYLTTDILSFLVSELQQYIPDMKCIGVVGREERA